MSLRKLRHMVEDLGKHQKQRFRRGSKNLNERLILVFYSVWSILSFIFKSKASHLKDTTVFLQLMLLGAELPGETARDSVL